MPEHAVSDRRELLDAENWEFPWVSSLGSDFKYDFGAAFTEEQQNNGADFNFKHVDQVAPQREGMSAFILQDGVVHHTYSSYARGVEQLMGTFAYLDVAPLGRNEDPQHTGAWWHRHDEYETREEQAEDDSRPLWVRRHDEYETA